MATPKYIILHHSASPQNQTAQAIDDYHRSKWNFRSSLGKYAGYQYIISKDGTVTQHRADTEAGAHCKEQDMNYQSIGICVTGWYDDGHNAMPTKAQQDALATLLRDKMKQWNIPRENIKFHRDYAAYKSCPGYHITQDWITTILGESMETKQLTDTQWQHLAELWGHQTGKDGMWIEKKFADDWILYYQKKVWESPQVYDTLRDLVTDPRFEESKNKVSWYGDRVRERDEYKRRVYDLETEVGMLQGKLDICQGSLERQSKQILEERRDVQKGAEASLGELRTLNTTLEGTITDLKTELTKSLLDAQNKDEQIKGLEKELENLKEAHKQSVDAIKKNKAEELSVGAILSLLITKLFKK